MHGKLFRSLYHYGEPEQDDMPRYLTGEEWREALEAKKQEYLNFEINVNDAREWLAVQGGFNATMIDTEIRAWNIEKREKTLADIREKE